MVKRVIKVSSFNDTGKESFVFSTGSFNFFGKEWGLVNSLKKVFISILGLGFFGLRSFCIYFNIPFSISIGFFNSVQLLEVKGMLVRGSFMGQNKYSNWEYNIGSFWRKVWLGNLFSIKSKGFVRFERLKKGLPVRGQRTKTNAKRCRRSNVRVICLSMSKKCVNNV